MLHPQNVVPPVVLPNEKTTVTSVPINSNFTVQSTPVQAPPVARNDFPQMVPPVMQTHVNNQAAVFAGECINKDKRRQQSKCKDVNLEY